MIDLGSSKVFEVKLGEKVYPLAEPKVCHVRKYQKLAKEADTSDELGAFIELVVDLGLPDEVAKNLSIMQLKKLSDGLLGGITEKKE